MVQQVESLQELMDHIKALEPLLGSMGDEVSLIDRDMRYLWASGTKGRVLDLSPSEIVGRRCYGVHHGLESPCPRCPISDVFTSGQVVEREFYIKEKQKYMLVRGIPVTGPDGSVLAAFEVARDITDKKRRQGDLEYRAGFYRYLFDNAPVGIFQVSPVDIFSEINPKYAQILGYDSPEELTGMLPGSVLADPSLTEGIVMELMEKPFQWVRREDVFRRRDGSAVDVETYSRVTLSPEGDFLRLDGYVIDISERKSLEREIQRELDLRQRIMDALPLGIIVKDREKRYILVNSHYADYIGIQKEGFYGKAASELFSPGRASPMEEEDDRLLATGKGFTKERTIRGRGGELRWHHVTKSPVYTSDGELFGIVGTAIDMTSLKEAMDALKMSEERFRSLAEDSPVMISTALQDGTILYANQAYSVFFGRSRDELLGIPFPELLPEEERIVAYRRLASLTPDNPIVHAEERYVDPKGVEHFFSWINRAFFDPDGNIQVMHSAGLDITAEKEAERAILAAKDEAQRASEAKSQLLANVSHEIRTPMNGILGLSELLLESGLNDEQHNYARMVHTSASNLLGVLNDLLDFSRMESKGVELNIMPFPVLSLLDDATELFALQAAEKGLSLELRVKGDLPSLLMGDPVRLRQVLINLLSNSVKFTSEGGVVLSAETVHSSPGNVDLLFSVSDTGPGIPEQLMEDIFTPFKQAQGSLNRKYGGSGLGLAISHQIVEAMGGFLLAESEPGEGSTFSFRLSFETPRDNPDATRGRDRPPRPDMKDVVPSVLIVEDNPVNRELVRLMLNKAGIKTTIADNGREAIDILSSRRFDLILMDIQMPEMDGYEATDIIRDRGSSVLDHSVPIIALTAHAAKDFREECLNRGMDDYLSKPFSSAGLMDMLYKWLPMRKADVRAKKPAPKKSLKDDDKELFDAEGFYSKLFDDLEEGKMLLELFLESTCHDMDLLRKKIAGGEYEDAAKIAHSIKGAAGNACSVRLSRVAKKLQLAAKDGDERRTAELLKELMEVYERVGKLVAEELKR
ncbi:MAG: PAS domain S-box protein [Synergistaceae bacterium]|nr:PAS domain S-box protein [Synergistaceae bacterium]